MSSTLSASIIMFIDCMPGASADTLINLFRDNSGETILISSAVVVPTLREAAATTSEAFLVSPMPRLDVIQYAPHVPWHFIWLGLVLRPSRL